MKKSCLFFTYQLNVLDIVLKKLWLTRGRTTVRTDGQVNKRADGWMYCLLNRWPNESTKQRQGITCTRREPRLTLGHWLWDKHHFCVVPFTRTVHELQCYMFVLSKNVREVQVPRGQRSGGHSLIPHRGSKFQSGQNQILIADLDSSQKSSKRK